MSVPLYVPGRPVTGPGGKCPFCLANAMLQGTIIVESCYGYAVQIADDLVLICPRDHETMPWGTPFHQERADLLRQVIEVVGWTDFNDSLNNGHVAGQRLEHIHYKVQRRSPGQRASGWGLDGLINQVNAAG